MAAAPVVLTRSGWENDVAVAPLSLTRQVTDVVIEASVRAVTFVHRLLPDALWPWFRTAETSAMLYAVPADGAPPNAAGYPARAETMAIFVVEL